jgi:hypothetical protein
MLLKPQNALTQIENMSPCRLPLSGTVFFFFGSFSEISTCLLFVLIWNYKETLQPPNTHGESQSWRLSPTPVAMENSLSDNPGLRLFDLIYLPLEDGRVQLCPNQRHVQDTSLTFCVPSSSVFYVFFVLSGIPRRQRSRQIQTAKANRGGCPPLQRYEEFIHHTAQRDS